MSDTDKLTQAMMYSAGVGVLLGGVLQLRLNALWPMVIGTTLLVLSLALETYKRYKLDSKADPDG
jgi:Flp pilus assembly protein TadB